MKVFLELVKSKAFPWILFCGVLLVVFIMFKSSNDHLSVEREYNRQLQGQLDEKERELQKFRSDLGISQAQLLTQKELADKVKKDKEELDKKFQKFVKENNLQISSRDKTIAELKQKIQSGETVVIVPNQEGCVGVESRCVISYSWEDTLKRFKLEDPNIFKQHNETFTSNQLFKVYGEVYEQKEGSLQIRRLVLREVYRKEDGTYTDVPDGKANIIDSKFDYINPPNIDTEPKIFNPRLIAVGLIDYNLEGVSSSFGLGAELLYYKKIGLSSIITPNFENLGQTKLMLGLEHSPKFSNLGLNLALGIFIGSPISKPEYVMSIGAIFYLTN